MDGPAVTAAEVTVQGHRWQVRCDAHSLLRVVATLRHAENIAALHQRIDHADDPVPEAGPPHTLAVLDLSAALRWVVTVEEAVQADTMPSSALIATLSTLAFLTHSTNDQVLELAHMLRDSPTTATINAYLPPF